MKIRHIPSINKKKSVYICLHHCYSGYVITCVHSIHQLSLHQNVRGIKPNQPREKHLDPFHSGGILLICLAQQKLDILSVLWCHGHSAQRLWSFPKCIYIYTVYISTFQYVRVHFQPIPTKRIFRYFGVPCSYVNSYSWDYDHSLYPVNLCTVYI